jgi:hypothetical protein
MADPAPDTPSLLPVLDPESQRSFVSSFLIPPTLPSLSKPQESDSSARKLRTGVRACQMS